MNLTVNIFRSGTSTTADADGQRLGMDFNKSNNYQGGFTGTMISLFTDFAYVVKSDGKMVRVKIGEIITVEIPV